MKKRTRTTTASYAGERNIVEYRNVCKFLKPRHAIKTFCGFLAHKLEERFG